MYKHILPLIITLALTSSTAMAQLRVEHFVRVKGQEPTVITGYGIVSGLNGTGDDPRAYTPFARAILRQLDRSGMYGSDEQGVRGARNSALVRVTVTVPGTGARSGDMLDAIVISEGNASSLAGGVLTVAHLSNPFQQGENALPQGMVQGRVTIENPASPNVGRIVRGCRLLADFNNPIVHEGWITLVIHQQHAHPNLANSIVEAINSDPELVMLSIQPPARAISAHEVMVRVPTTHFGFPMDFLAKILNAEIIDVPQPLPRVTINERTGTITICVNVEVRPTLITHGGFMIDIPAVLEDGEEEVFPQQFLAIDTNARLQQMTGGNGVNMRLRALQSSLNALRATSQEIIDIIKALERQGAIVGEVIFVD